MSAGCGFCCARQRRAEEFASVRSPASRLPLRAPAADQNDVRDLRALHPPRLRTAVRRPRGQHRSAPGWTRLWFGKVARWPRSGRVAMRDSALGPLRPNPEGPYRHPRLARGPLALDCAPVAGRVSTRGAENRFRAPLDRGRGSSLPTVEVLRPTANGATPRPPVPSPWRSSTSRPVPEPAAPPAVPVRPPREPPRRAR